MIIEKVIKQRFDQQEKQEVQREKEPTMEPAIDKTKAFMTRVIATTLFTEFAIWSWGWATTAVPECAVQKKCTLRDHKEIFAWLSSIITGLFWPWFGIWTTDELFKVHMDSISNALHMSYRFAGLIFVVTFMIIPLLLAYHIHTFHHP